ncbi:S-methyl-5'-thioadenosine phosphorylase [Methanobacterium alcaliphilum]|uniref:S-methyl-5'-thioadenosine phosphorylase n=1 Tax=Methanobacterium alcaliphilum TaxID=392018 RepID=UPI00200A0C0A|nr:S-methyl-5'-thioadenosine phosphorylase [Methanobacterium alcaliphilum]MCK9152568.1 S-methyl-5'-thioadenosine phosphorylase [Methanobacterium alcaliphilum]
MIGIIGGTGVYEITEHGNDVEKKVIKTPYGNSPEISLFKLQDKDVAFIPRHATGHDYPPHMINYQANVWALKKIGVKQVIATNAVGSLKESIGPGDFVIPHDFIDFTKIRPSTFYDNRTVHIDVTSPYCENLRNHLISAGEVVDQGIYVCTEGPRFETAAEIKMFQILGGTLVGMTGIPEATLAREVEMCYASVCMVSNYAASISPDKLTIAEVFDIMEKRKHELVQLIEETITNMPYDGDCPCQNALDGAEVI